jgi:hypothetical protein
MFSGRLGRSGTSSAGRVHLCGIETTAQRQTRTHASSEQQGLGPWSRCRSSPSSSGSASRPSTTCAARAAVRADSGSAVSFGPGSARWTPGSRAWKRAMPSGTHRGRGDAHRSGLVPRSARTAQLIPDVSVVASWRRPGFATSTGASARSGRSGRPRPPREPAHGGMGLRGQCKVGALMGPVTSPCGLARCDH